MIQLNHKLSGPEIMNSYFFAKLNKNNGRKINEYVCNGTILDLTKKKKNQHENLIIRRFTQVVYVYVIYKQTGKSAKTENDNKYLVITL